MYYGMGCACCETPKGLGSIDLSTLSWEDYFLIGIVGTLVIGVVQPSIFEPSRPRRRKKKSSGGSPGFGAGIISTALLFAGGYLAYSYFTQNQGAQTS